MKILRIAVCTITALAAMANSALANEWVYENGEKTVQPIPLGEKKSFPLTTGRAKLKIQVGTAKTVNVSCTFSGKVVLSNTENEALDEMTGLEFSACSNETTITAITPWPSELLGEGRPFNDRMSNVTVEVSKSGANYGMFSAELLNTEFGDGDAPMPPDDVDSTLHIRSGKLKGTNGAEGTVSLTVITKFGEKGNRAGGLPTSFTNQLDSTAGQRLEIAMDTAARTPDDDD